MRVPKTAMHSVWEAASVPPHGEDVIPLRDFQRSVTPGNPWRPLLHTLYLADVLALAGGDGSARRPISLEGRDD